MRTGWNRTILVIAAVSVLLISTLTSTAQAADYDQRFYNYGGWWSPPVALRSPNRNASGIDVYNAINSKWNQPRDVSAGTNPHQGLDISNTQGTEVYAVSSGTVVRKGTYEVLISVSGNWYMQYRHITPEASLAVGSTVTPTTKLGKVTIESGYPEHLHIGMVYGLSSDYNHNLWTNNDYWFPNAAYWNYGTDLDFITRPYVNTTNQLFVTAYATTDGSVPYMARQVVVWHRNPYNTSGWVSSTMSVYSSPSYRWMIDFRSLRYKDSTGNLRYYTSGDNVQYIVVAYRALESTFKNLYSYDWSVYPGFYQHPSADPNTWTSSPVYASFTYQ